MSRRDYNTGIQNCMYAIHGSSTKKQLNGAIKLSFRPSSGDRKLLVRDSKGAAMQYTDVRRSNTRQATLEIVSLPVSFLIDVLGWTQDSSGVLYESIQPDIHISLFYETENGGHPIRHQLYDCVVCSPSFDVSTMTRQLSVNPRKLDIIVNPDRSTGKFSRQIARDDNTTLYNNWFESV